MEYTIQIKTLQHWCLQSIVPLNHVDLLNDLMPIAILRNKTNCPKTWSLNVSYASTLSILLDWIKTRRQTCPLFPYLFIFQVPLASVGFFILMISIITCTWSVYTYIHACIYRFTYTYLFIPMYILTIVPWTVTWPRSTIHRGTPGKLAEGLHQRAAAAAAAQLGHSIRSEIEANSNIGFHP